MYLLDSDPTLRPRLLSGLSNTVGSTSSVHGHSMALPITNADETTGANLSPESVVEPMDKKKKNALLNQSKNKAAMAKDKIEEVKLLKDEISGNDNLCPLCTKLPYM